MNALDKLSGRKVLVVDDDPRNTFALVSYLESCGMIVLVAEDGFKALEMLTADSGVDIILMDMMMPEMDGYETISRIRDINSLSKIPIIAVTARAMIGDREKCIEAGAAEYVSKPVDISQLQDKMSKLIR